MKTFEGKVAVITGAASGIGRGLTERCLAEGMHVVMADIEEDVLNKTADALRAEGNNSIVTVKTDVSVLAEIENLKQVALDSFGAVHLLFNNAGVGGGGNAWDATQKDWEWVIGVNLWSVIHGVRVFTPQMISQGDECHIVNTASVAGLVGGSTNACYSVTKHGVVALTENLYRDLATAQHNIGTSVLCPGFINTNIMDSGRNRPDHLQEAAADEPVTPEQEKMRKLMADFLEKGMQPGELADIVFKGIRAERLYILTHEDFNEIIMSRAENITTGNNPPVTNFAGQ
ncbi:MAG: SDR family NAD(P)-dependent oxidoreductase [Pseudomonadales bacterium]|jgi:NAD(P)-dependent dehydrogenase (short-subunit alcohol dehydrogenase family)|tara:strand:- start:37008 stop:37868 length:861 start_codon:yes stop_codon:yes gene_type:complete